MGVGIEEKKEKMQKRKQAPPLVFTPASEAVKVDVYDQNAVKQLLDDVIMTYVLETRGLEEDLTYSNYKLALGGLSCLVAIASHAYPAPFPENAWVLKVCVVSYIVLSALLQTGRHQQQEAHQAHQRPDLLPQVRGGLHRPGHHHAGQAGFALDLLVHRPVVPARWNLHTRVLHL